jgi:predicted dehydrogenase
MKELDAVMIGAWPYLHRPASIAALDAGKHVFTQARMAMDYKEAKEMYEKAREKGLVNMVCPAPHAMKGDNLMRKLLKDGYVGKVYNILVRDMNSQYSDPAAPLHWRQVRKYSGFNTLTLGMHVEVIHRWFGYAKKVVALDQTFTKERKDPESGKMGKVERPDSVMIAAEMENGSLAQFVFSGVTLFPEESIISIYGSEGTLIYRMATHEILGARKGDKELKPIPIPPDLAKEWTVEADFIAAIRQGKKVEPTFYEGMKYMEFTEAAFRSAESGGAVSLPLE